MTTGRFVFVLMCLVVACAAPGSDSDVDLFAADSSGKADGQACSDWTSVAAPSATMLAANAFWSGAVQTSELQALNGASQRYIERTCFAPVAGCDVLGFLTHEPGPIPSAPSLNTRVGQAQPPYLGSFTNGYADHPELNSTVEVYCVAQDWFDFSFDDAPDKPLELLFAPFSSLACAHRTIESAELDALVASTTTSEVRFQVTNQGPTALTVTEREYIPVQQCPLQEPCRSPVYDRGSIRWDDVPAPLSIPANEVYEGSMERFFLSSIYKDSDDRACFYLPEGCNNIAYKRHAIGDVSFDANGQPLLGQPTVSTTIPYLGTFSIVDEVVPDEGYVFEAYCYDYIADRVEWERIENQFDPLHPSGQCVLLPHSNEEFAVRKDATRLTGLALNFEIRNHGPTELSFADRHEHGWGACIAPQPIDLLIPRLDMQDVPGIWGATMVTYPEQFIPPGQHITGHLGWAETALRYLTEKWGPERAPQLCADLLDIPIEFVKYDVDLSGFDHSLASQFGGITATVHPFNISVQCYY